MASWKTATGNRFLNAVAKLKARFPNLTDEQARKRVAASSTDLKQ